MDIISPAAWHDYELLDSGNFKKLERFGSHILIRPEPQALWETSLTPQQWQQQAHVEFAPADATSGTWLHHAAMPHNWTIQYDSIGLQAQLKLTKFKHIGIFPEQAANWDYIFANCSKSKNIKVLNLFAYTGMATLAAAAAGAQVTHVDSVKQVVQWAKSNMQLSGTQSVRWIIDDAKKFAQRELQRGNIYNGILLDPPAFGRGANGESWKYERDIVELLHILKQILHNEKYFFVFNSYSFGFSPSSIYTLLHTVFNNFKAPKEVGELCLTDSFNKILSTGSVGRFSSLL